MFVFKPTKQTYSDPVSATFLPGIPFGRERSRGDICLLHEGFAASKIFLNSIVLREAILNSKEYLENVLDLKITDKRATKSEEELQKIKKPKAKAKDAELYMAEEIIEEEPKNEEVKETIPTEEVKEDPEVVEEIETEIEPTKEE